MRSLIMDSWETNKNKKITGKFANFTGGSRGLGRAMALSLSAAGATIALAARDAEKLAEVKAEIEAAGGKASAYVVDVVSEESVAKLQSDVAKELGAVQLLNDSA